MKKTLFTLILFAASNIQAQLPPDLLLVKTGPQTPFANGDTISYRLIAFNNTGVPQPNISIVDNVPVNFKVTSLTSPSWV